MRGRSLLAASVLIAGLAIRTAAAVSVYCEPYYFKNGVRDTGFLTGHSQPGQPVGLPVTFESGTSFTNYAIPPAGLALDKWVLATDDDLRMTFTLAKLPAIATYTGYNVTVSWTEELGEKLKEQNYLCPCFSWLKYTLKYDPNWDGRSVVTDGTYVYTNEVTLATSETVTNRIAVWQSNRKGYEIEGWSTNSEDVVAAYAKTQKVERAGEDFGATTNGLVTLYAIWKKSDIPVALDPQGGEVSPTDIVVHVEEPYDLPTPSWADHEFMGWHTASTGGLLVTNGQVVTDVSVRTLYAQWEERQYHSVTFSFKTSTGGSTNVVESVLHGTAATPPQATSPVGYYFDGWEGSYENVLSDVTVRAVYQANGYSVTFDPNGGQGTMSAQSFTYGVGKNLSANAFTKFGHTFVGWALSPDASTAVYADKEGVSDLTSEDGGEVCLYALWKPNSYTVVYSPGEAFVTGTVEDQRATWGVAFALRKNRYVCDGLAFRCWQDAAGVEYEAQATVSNLTAEANGRVTMTAVWSWSYTMSFDANGGSGTMDDVVCDGGSPQAIPACTFTRTGYSFAGWAMTAKSGAVYADGQEVSASDLDVGIGETAVLYAVWTPNDYSVAFEANGGTGTMAPMSFVYDRAQALTANVFTRGSREFRGWTTNALSPVVLFEDRASVSNLTAVKDATVTLHALWTEGSYSVRFNANGGTGMMPDEKFTVDTPKTLTANAFTRVGYVFDGWASSVTGTKAYDDGQEVSNLASEDQTVDLYAQWVPIAYTIAFDAGGGSGAMAPLSVKYDEVVQLTPNAFVNSDLAFRGWTGSDGNRYADRATVSNLTVTAGTTITLTAIWPGAYYMSFEGNGATNAVAMALQRFVDDEEKPLASNAYARVGYSFVGWATSSDGPAVYADGQVVSSVGTSGKTNSLYAVWSPNAYTVSFNANGGSGTMSPQPFVYDTPQALSSNLFVRGSNNAFVFDGWSRNSSAEAEYADGAVVQNLAEAGAVTLYARWRNNLGGLAQAADADFELNKEDREPDTWQIDETVKYMGPASVRVSGVSNYSCITGAVTGAGTLTFKWRSNVEMTTQVPGARFAYHMPGQVELYKPLPDLPVADKWTTVTFVIESEGPTILYWQAFRFGELADGAAVWIDDIRWEPAGSGEPTEADAPVISTVSTRSGGLDLTIESSDPRFDYQLISSPVLSFDPCSISEPVPGNGSPIEFTDLIDERETTMFYRVRVIKRQ